MILDGVMLYVSDTKCFPSAFPAVMGLPSLLCVMLV